MIGYGSDTHERWTAHLDKTWPSGQWCRSRGSFDKELPDCQIENKILAGRAGRARLCWVKCWRRPAPPDGWSRLGVATHVAAARRHVPCHQPPVPPAYPRPKDLPFASYLVVVVLVLVKIIEVVWDWQRRVRLVDSVVLLRPRRCNPCMPVARGL